MKWILHRYPFNAEQTVNLLSEFGPLATLFVINAVLGVTAGIWSLIITTMIALATMKILLNRLPVFALIAGGITLVFSAISLYTKDPMWVQLKVTLFNGVFALFLTVGLATQKNFFKYTFEKTFHYTSEGWNKFTRSFIILFFVLALANEAIRLSFPWDKNFNFLGWSTDGLNVWVMFKIIIVMPLSGIHAYFMTRMLKSYTTEPTKKDARHPA